MIALRPSRMRGASLALAACLVLAACGSSTSTKPVTTDVPIPIAAVKATPTPAPTATTVVAATPTATELATATPVPAATATPAASAAADRGAGCSGTQQFKDMFAAAAAELSFDVYCAVLPDDYWVHTGEYTVPAGGVLVVDYRNGRGFEIELVEGYFCTSGDSCLPPTSLVARIWFGDLGAGLYPLAEPGFVGPAVAVMNSNIAWVDMGNGLTYRMVGTGMSRSTFINLAQAAIKVPKA